MPKAYEPGAIEPRWAQEWVEKRLFTPGVYRAVHGKMRDERTIFSLAIPPPNFDPCTHLQGLKAQVGYTHVEGQTYAGEIISIEIRE